jgi:tyrosyl-tRNA synthetase
MSVPDGLVKQYSLVYTELPLQTVEELGDQAVAGGRAARDAKLRLAESVVTRYHGAEAAAAERVNFTSIFSDRNQPGDIAELVVTQRRLTVLELLRAARPGDSNSELRRLIRQGAVALDGEKATDPEQAVDLHDRESVVLRSGRRAWHRIRMAR